MKSTDRKEKQIERTKKVLQLSMDIADDVVPLHQNQVEFESIRDQGKEGKELEGRELEKGAKKPKRKKIKIKISELVVIVNAEKLNDYLHLITKNAPKEYRGTTIEYLLSNGDRLIDNLFNANGMFDYKSRYSYQRQADIAIQKISHYILQCKNKKIISLKQLEHSAVLIHNTRTSLYAWLNTNPVYKELLKNKNH